MSREANDTAMIEKGRLMAITDGIVAIAATIMVLQLKVPDQVSMAAVKEQWPTFLAYIISFIQIFMAWHEHHDSFAFAERINHRIFLVNCLWLFFITMLPLTTGIIGESPRHMPSILLYIAMLLLVQMTITIESHMIRKLNGTPILDEEVIRKIRVISFAGYIIAAVSTMIKPVSGLVIILILSAAEIFMVCAFDRKIDPSVLTEEELYDQIKSKMKK